MTWRVLGRAGVAGLALAASACAATAGPMLWQTNSGGNDIHVFDLESRTRVRRLVVGPEPHGIAAPADASVGHVTLEANGRARGELLWIDPRHYAVRHPHGLPRAARARHDPGWPLDLCSLLEPLRPQAPSRPLA